MRSARRPTPLTLFLAFSLCPLRIRGGDRDARRARAGRLRRPVRAR
jgi:hypothetical protein